jgi:YOP proteins translocation protein K (YscK)
MKTPAGLVQAARACSALRSRAAIGWAELLAWPDWALPAPRGALDAHVLRCGALAYAEALRSCIDGPTLQAAHELLGRSALLALLQGQAPALVQRAALPRIDALESSWRNAGRALWIGSVPPGPLREALLEHLAWPAIEATDLPPAQAQALVEWASALPGDEEPITS